MGRVSHLDAFTSTYIFDVRSGEISFISAGNFAAVVVDIFGREYQANIIKG